MGRGPPTLSSSGRRTPSFLGLAVLSVIPTELVALSLQSVDPVDARSPSPGRFS